MVPATVSFEAGVVVPMPIFPEPFSVITESPRLLDPVHLVICPSVPLPVTGLLLFA